MPNPASQPGNGLGRGGYKNGMESLVRIQSVHNSLYLDHVYGLDVNDAPLTYVPLSLDSPFQLWRLIPVAAESEYCYIMSESTGRCLDIWGFDDAPGARIVLWERTNKCNQRWRFLEQPDGSFLIQCESPANVMDVQDCRIDPGGLITAHPAHGGPNQLWRLRLI